MEKSVKKFRNFISLWMDFLVMMSWFASFRVSLNILIPIMLSLTVLHVFFITGVYHFIKRKSLIYAMPVQQKYIILGIVIVTSLLCLISALTGDNAISLFIMLMNGLLVLSYPNLRFVK